uniref:uncharacterized protein LOC108950918 n=1 Tax=Ciona intestinalis TaxID=7719 RepID=UPI00089DCBF5|nr:uncharacterized protein LOC108950918 [Ciona intestinalis]|eukprot:XP_018672717.1 uncharacterized protein LOC108950918 [Ciona intestinalis]
MTGKAKQKRESSASRPVVTIKHGKAPEVQEVDFATRVNDVPELYTVIGDPVVETESRKHRRKSKSMTTKSTMTNEDDYTVVHTNTPCTSPTSSVRCDDANDVMEVGHKMVGWKMTPRVHFPPPNTLNAASLRTSELKRINKKKADEVKIDPPFIHRPDRTFMVHQHMPLPMQPVKAWPGYGGNVYFHPVQVDMKPIRDRAYSTRSPGPRSKSVATSSHYNMSLSSPDLFSMPRYTPHSRHNAMSPSLASTRRPMSQFIEVNDKQDEIEQANLIRHRQMSRLDKKYILNLPKNTSLNEDWSWIQGSESLGSLKIGNPELDLERHSMNETFTRHTFVEKIPRNFIFHPSNGAIEPEAVRKSKLPAKLNPLAVRNYCYSHGIPEWALRQFVDKHYRNADGQLKFPTIPLRIKGKGVTDNPHSSNISAWRPVVANNKGSGKSKKTVTHIVPQTTNVVSNNHVATNELYENPLNSENRESERTPPPEDRFSNLKDLLVQHYKRNSESNMMT